MLICPLPLLPLTLEKALQKYPPPLHFVSAVGPEAAPSEKTRLPLRPSPDPSPSPWTPRKGSTRRTPHRPPSPCSATPTWTASRRRARSGRSGGARETGRTSPARKEALPGPERVYRRFSRAITLPPLTPTLFESHGSHVFAGQS